MTLVFWIIVLSVFLGFFFWATNLLKTEAEGEKFDAGLAILEFGKAYPDEAVANSAATLEQRTMEALRKPDLKGQGREFVYA